MTEETKRKKERRASPDVLARRLKNCADMYDAYLAQAEKQDVKVTCCGQPLPKLNLTEIKIEKTY